MRLVLPGLHALFPAGEPQISQVTFVKREFFGGLIPIIPSPMPSEQNQGHSIFSIKPRIAPKCSTAGRASTL